MFGTVPKKSLLIQWTTSVDRRRADRTLLTSCCMVLISKKQS